MSLTNENGMVMPVGPMGSYGYNDGFGGNGMWWLLVLFLFAFTGNGWGNNFGGGGMPYMMNANTNNDVQRGFDQSAVMNGLQGINSGISGINTALCNGFAGVNATINSGFANAETAATARQMANMQQAFAAQTAVTSGVNQLASQFADSCCENRLATANLQSTILAENCADRAAVSDALRDVINNQNAGIQRILDQMCNDKIDSKNEKIAELQSQLQAANLAASQNALASRILADNQAQTQALEQYLNPAPIPAYVVQNPNCCGNYFNGCGCNG